MSLSASHPATERRPEGWPSEYPVWTITVFVLAAVIVPGRAAWEYARHWSDLGAHYLPDYALSGAGLAGRYWQLYTVTPRGLHLTTSREVNVVSVAGSRCNVRQMPLLAVAGHQSGRYTQPLLLVVAKVDLGRK